MKNTLTIAKYTLREALSRKIFIVFFGISTLILIIFALIFGLTSLDTLMNIKLDSQGIQTAALKQVAEFFKTIIVMPLFGGGLFLSIFSAASFIPNMLEKGNIDLLLSKPVSRAQVIWGKFWGGTTIVFFNIAFLVTGLWILIGLKFSVWEAELLVTIITITFTFAVLYALMILTGILTRSSVLAMMLTYLIFFIFSPLLLARENIYILLDNKFIEYILDGLYYLVPKTSELGSMTANLAAGGSIGSFQPIISSFLFMILSLGLSIFIFNKKDY